MCLIDLVKAVCDVHIHYKYRNVKHGTIKGDKDEHNFITRYSLVPTLE